MGSETQLLVPIGINRSQLFIRKFLQSYKSHCRLVKPDQHWAKSAGSASAKSETGSIALEKSIADYTKTYCITSAFISTGSFH